MIPVVVDAVSYDRGINGRRVAIIFENGKKKKSVTANGREKRRYLYDEL